MPEHAAQLGLGELHARRHLGAEVVEQRGTRVEVVVLLRVVARRHLVAELEVTEVGLRLTGQDAQQARLAGPVEAEHQQPLATAEIERDVLEHGWTTVALAQVLGLDDGAPARRRIGESHRDDLVAFATWTFSDSRRAMRFSMLWALAAFVAFAPKRSTNFCIRAISFSCCAACLARRPRPRPASGDVLRVGALVLDDLARWRLGGPVEVQHAGDRLVEQFEVVADDEQGAAVLAEEPEQPHLGVDVEVVRGLVEAQHVAAGEQDAGQLDAAAFTAREHPDGELHAALVESRPAARARASLSAE